MEPSPHTQLDALTLAQVAPVLAAISEALRTPFRLVLRSDRAGGAAVSLTASPGREPQPEVAAGEALDAVTAPVVVGGRSVGTLAIGGAGVRRKMAGSMARAAAGLVGLALARSEAADQARRLAQELEDLRRRVLQSEEDERKLVSMEIHDSVSQHLAFLYFQIQLFEDHLVALPQTNRDQFTQIRELARCIVEDTSRLLLHLRPPHLEDLGLVPALKRYLESFMQQSGIPTDLRVGRHWPLLADHRALAIYRIVQEALNNVWKHARAARVGVALTRPPDQLCVLIRDDGVGFDAVGLLKQAHPRGYGIVSMAERARWCGGQLQVVSHPGRGCEVRFSMPAALERVRPERR